MAVEAVFGGTTVWHAEIDKAASKVLAYRWPEVPNLGDITQVDWANWKPLLEVDVLCGGFPCQDVSSAGKRAGIKSGTRSGLWSIFAEAIDILRPPIVVIENVRGLLSAAAHRMEPDETTLGDRAGGPVLRAAGAVLGDLADLGYDAQWATVAAGDIGAPHRRERVFILASAGHAQDGGGFFQYRNASEAWSARSIDGEGENGAEVRSHVDLLPTPRSSDCFGAGLHGDGGMDLRTTVTLLPTPNAVDGHPTSAGRHSTPKHPTLNGEARLLCTPSASDGAGGKTSRSGGRIDEPLLGGQAREMETSWGKYEPAIRRWESLTRPAPPPTEPNKNGNPRLAAAFSEWLMGWPAGWVTQPAIGISRNDQLRIVGNGVCPQQAAAALRYLIAVSEEAAYA
jgi:DNA (cytosine-5)-methyltransferase 1